MYLATIPPYKDKCIGPFLNYLDIQLKKLNVEIRLNTTITSESLNDLKPDVVVLATGAKPIVPNIQGINNSNVVTYFDVLAGLVKTGTKVVVVGGGSTGCETAEYLHCQGKEVTVVEMLLDPPWSTEEDH